MSRNIFKVSAAAYGWGLHLVRLPHSSLGQRAGGTDTNSHKNNIQTSKIYFLAFVVNVKPRQGFFLQQRRSKQWMLVTCRISNVKAYSMLLGQRTRKWIFFSAPHNPAH